MSAEFPRCLTGVLQKAFYFGRKATFQGSDSYIENRMQDLKTAIKTRIASTGANDLWLMTFWSIHIFYISLSVVLPLPDGHDKSVLDVVMRTAAVLVGYFLSKNFFRIAPSRTNLSESATLRKTLQTNVAGSIGLCSLCLIFCVRYVDALNLPYNSVSQLRDFYLAAVAFLMGTGD